MIIIIEFTRLQVELKAKIKYSIAAINSIHFKCSTVCYNVLGFVTYLGSKGQWRTLGWSENAVFKFFSQTTL